jgi:hypothetical protein
VASELHGFTIVGELYKMLGSLLCNFKLPHVVHLS